MTQPIDLLDRAPPPGVRFLRAWLAPLTESGAEREPENALPFTLIQRYDGWEDAVTDHGFYQLDHLAKASDGKTAFTACEDYSRLCMQRILYLRDHSWTEISVPDWGQATADLVRCIESPRRKPYKDSSIVRMVSRFAIDLRLVTV